MKPIKILALILALIMSLALVACGKAETPQESDTQVSPTIIEETSKPTTTTEPPSAETELQNATSEHTTVSKQESTPEPSTETLDPTTPTSQINETPPDSNDDSPNIHIDSDSVKEFKEFIKIEKAKGTDLSPYFLLPSTSLPGYELDSVSYEMNGDISDMDGTVCLTYKDNEAQNANRTTLTYFIYTWNYDLAQDSLRIAATNGKRVNVEDREIYYYTDLDYYIFTFIHDYKLVSAIVPFVDGFNATDMVKYLDMVNVT